MTVPVNPNTFPSLSLALPLPLHSPFLPSSTCLTPTPLFTRDRTPRSPHVSNANGKEEVDTTSSLYYGTPPVPPPTSPGHSLLPPTTTPTPTCHNPTPPRHSTPPPHSVVPTHHGPGNHECVPGRRAIDRPRRARTDLPVLHRERAPFRSRPMVTWSGPCRRPLTLMSQRCGLVVLLVGGSPPAHDPTHHYPGPGPQ